MPNLKHLQWGDVTYDFDASAFNGKNYDQVKADIINAVDTAQFIVSTNAANTPNITELYDPIGVTGIPGTLAPADADRNNIYLVLAPSDPPYYEEYIVTLINEVYTWIHLGNTDVDLSDYVRKGEERTTSQSGANTITGTASVDYDKPNAKTASGSGSQSAITTYATPTATATFTGSSITFSPTATFSYNPILTVNKATASITFATGSETGSGGSHSHTLSTHTHTTQTVVNSITFTPSSLSTTTMSIVKSVTATSGSFLQGNVTGDTLILTGANAIKSISPIKDTVISGITFTPSSLSSTTVNVAAVSSATTSRTSIESDHTHTLDNVVLNPVIGVSINPGKPSISISSITYTPAGSISISIASHCHSYNAPANHQHDIVTTSTKATGSATITISNHTHKVDL